MPETLGPAVLATSFTFVSASTCIVGIRFYCRHFLVGALRIYDHLMLLALLLTWGIAVINYFQVKYGTGIHAKDQDPIIGMQNLKGTLKSWYTYQMVYLIDLCAVKFSILTFYHAMSARRSHRLSVYITMAIVAAFTVAMVFVNAFECDKPSDAWSTEILLQDKGSCHDLHPIYYSQAAFNIASDIAILLLPMPVLRKLNMKRNKRFALIGIFSVGSFAVIASIIRIYALHVWSSDASDVPYTGANILIWSQVEINIAIISASIPSLKVLFNRTFSGDATYKNSQGYYSRYGHQSWHRRGQSQTGLVTSITASVSKSRHKSVDHIEELKGMPKLHVRGHRDDSSDERLVNENSIVNETRWSTVDKSRHHPRNNNSWRRDTLHKPDIHVSRSVVVESTSRSELRSQQDQDSPDSPHGGHSQWSGSYKI
ncbi:hypothetical protein AJ79_08005 [Helicocarpus griseus UAMH5409]|uniref:Rhodopsin domain-containing protein n=1 Tax=Helicocarpus griseus UAMH5409 TaxID=1447875 RepID=A0A2B7WP27_9EURO|nr:hypothetical protein AJ79_08005 [Helicocarpus griseus UAMH5409]